MQTKGSRKRKFTLLEDSSDSSTDNVMHPADEKTKRKDEPRPFCDLLSLLRHSRYPEQLTSANSHDSNDPAALYSWEELYKEMRWTDVKLKKVMTSDSYVIIDGNTIFLKNFTTSPYVVLLP